MRLLRTFPRGTIFAVCTPDFHSLSSASGLCPAPPPKLQLAENNAEGACEPRLSSPRPLFFLASPASLSLGLALLLPLRCYCHSALLGSFRPHLQPHHYLPANDSTTLRPNRFGDSSNLAAPRRSYRPSHNGQEEVTQSDPVSLYPHFAAKQTLMPSTSLNAFPYSRRFLALAIFSYHLFSNR